MNTSHDCRGFVTVRDAPKSCLGSVATTGRLSHGNLLIPFVSGCCILMWKWKYAFFSWERSHRDSSKPTEVHVRKGDEIGVNETPCRHVAGNSQGIVPMIIKDVRQPHPKDRANAR